LSGCAFPLQRARRERAGRRRALGSLKEAQEGRQGLERTRDNKTLKTKKTRAAQQKRKFRTRRKQRSWKMMSGHRVTAIRGGKETERVGKLRVCGKSQRERGEEYILNPE